MPRQEKAGDRANLAASMSLQCLPLAPVHLKLEVTRIPPIQGGAMLLCEYLELAGFIKLAWFYNI